MGQAKAEEQRLKDLTLAQLRDELAREDAEELAQRVIQGALMPWLQQNLAGIVDGMVKERIADYHTYLASRGIFEKDPEGDNDSPIILIQ